MAQDHHHLAAIEASQRAIAKVAGVGRTTIARDLDGPNGPPIQEKPNETKAPDPPRVPNGPRTPDSGRAAAQKLAEKDKLPRSGNATHDNDDEWYTPPEIIEVCRTAMGGIDLAPASHNPAALAELMEIAQLGRFETVQAAPH